MGRHKAKRSMAVYDFFGYLIVATAIVVLSTGAGALVSVIK